MAHQKAHPFYEVYEAMSLIEIKRHYGNSVFYHYITKDEMYLIGVPKYNVHLIGRVGKKNDRSIKYLLNVRKIDPHSKREGCPFVVERSYCDFELLHRNVVSMYETDQRLMPIFPQRISETQTFRTNHSMPLDNADSGFHGTSDQNVIFAAKECIQLNEYINGILFHPSIGISSSLKEFLESDINSDFYGKMNLIHNETLLSGPKMSVSKLTNSIEDTIYSKHFKWVHIYRNVVKKLTKSENELIESHIEVLNKVTNHLLL